ncbi:Uncharacterised protein [Mycobacteroides abscessus subsp. abscessus]|nr:Uncharacterised protein [Mycobacteroides abscessus subsp. abscessus]
MECGDATDRGNTSRSEGGKSPSRIASRRIAGFRVILEQLLRSRSRTGRVTVISYCCPLFG